MNRRGTVNRSGQGSPAGWSRTFSIKLIKLDARSRLEWSMKDTQVILSCLSTSFRLSTVNSLTVGVPSSRNSNRALLVPKEKRRFLFWKSKQLDKFCILDVQWKVGSDIPARGCTQRIWLLWSPKTFLWQWSLPEMEPLAPWESANASFRTVYRPTQSKIRKITFFEIAGETLKQNLEVILYLLTGDCVGR